MGTKKQWTGREKIAIVLEGLKGECRISKLCNEHGISQRIFRDNEITHLEGFEKFVILRWKEDF